MLSAVTLCGFSLRGNICYDLIDREDICTLEVPPLKNSEIKKDIETLTIGMDPAGIVAFCDWYTKNHLSFSLTSPCRDISYKGENHRENCIGYAKYLSAMLSYAFEVNGIEGKVIHCRGIFHLGNVNLMKIFSRIPGIGAKYGTDHDYVRIEGAVGGIVDPSIDDILMINPSFHLRRLRR